MRKIEFNEKSRSFIRLEEIKIDDYNGVKDIEETLKKELMAIIKQVKGLKIRAEEIKSILAAIKKKAGPNRPAPALAEPQLPSAETPGPM